MPEAGWNWLGWSAEQGRSHVADAESATLSQLAAWAGPSALGTEQYLTVARIDGRSGAERVCSRRPALDPLSSWSGAC